MKKWALLTCSLLLIAGVAQAQETTSEFSEIAKLVQSFRDADVRGNLVVAVDPEVVSPFGGPSQLPDSTTGPITLNGTFSGLVNPMDMPVPLPPGAVLDGRFPPGPLPMIRFDHPLLEPIDQLPPLAGEGLTMEEAIRILEGSFDSDFRTAGTGDPFLTGGPLLIDGGVVEAPIPLDCPGHIMEFGRVDAIEGQPIWQGFAENDLFNGGSQAIVTRCINGQWELERLVNQGNQFAAMPTDAFTIIFEEGWLTFVPFSEVQGSMGSRNFGFVTPFDNPFQPDTTGSTASPFPGLAEPGFVLLVNDPESFLPGPPAFSQPTVIDFSNGSCAPDSFRSTFEFFGLGVDGTPQIFLEQLSTGQLVSGMATPGDPFTLEGSGPGYTERYSWSGTEIGTYQHSNATVCTWDVAIPPETHQLLQNNLRELALSLAQPETTTSTSRATATPSLPEGQTFISPNGWTIVFVGPSEVVAGEDILLQWCAFDPNGAPAVGEAQGSAGPDGDYTAPEATHGSAPFVEGCTEIELTNNVAAGQTIGLAGFFEEASDTPMEFIQTQVRSAVEESPDTTASPFWPWILIGLGLAGLGLGGFFLLGAKDPCEELRKAWEAAERRRKTAQEGLDQAEQNLKERKNRVTELEADLAALERSAQSSVTEHGVTYHLIEGGRVTTEGLESLTATARRDLADAKATEADAEASVKEWKQRVADAAKAADDAKAAYERCVGEHTPKTPEPEQPGTVTGGPVVATPPPTQPAECQEGDREVRPAGKADSINVDVDFSLFVEVLEGSERKVDAAKTLAVDLSDLASQLGTLGSMLGAYGSGRSTAQGVMGMAAGKYTVGGGKLVRGGVEGYIAGADPNIGTQSFPISVPTSPQEVVTEFWEGTARLGSIVADKVGDWLKMNQLYQVRMTYFYQTMTAAPHQLWVCRGGRWVCEETIYEITIGSLQKRPGPKQGPFRLESDIARHRMQSEIDRMTSRARSTLSDSARRKAEFEQSHQPGPCQ